ncbi:putative imidazole glycerol phosphate synthase,glutamine amidotransferase subunit (HisH) [Legionella lansingensis]|uniref:Imidazole glycerol phosphate synthase subunit HisH n=1 Tax=Legionella lansingensis TaxID=45067 RepID=A0A0W0VVG8_9GAMM|nr:imidazole glycerol phosphate synthase subunit HisH [Legionella lansingensis]KTD24308.1 putative imidazole glycerol phosphate synthase,glutamine amidotransferase subunit (HisH) [Legionella lansingensis]SNV51838.1 putative imidazole glycerol phosphate synthase,glutamine amidotransferase subunit (HisH) [Legionella lansingensis]
MHTAKKSVVGIIDYQAGNIQSIENAFNHIGARVLRVTTEKQLLECTHLVLPGVGAFGFCVENLRSSEFIPSIERWAFEERKPLLGICVGMQLLTECSEESPETPGLSWFNGDIKRIPTYPGIRVPHVGWNSVQFECDFGEFISGNKADFYFDHSFAYQNPTEKEVVGFCTHGVRFGAIIKRDNIIAAQFHPEKSQEAGLRFLRGFLLQ